MPEDFFEERRSKRMSLPVLGFVLFLALVLGLMAGTAYTREIQFRKEFVSQAGVDCHLMALANVFHDACTKQAELQGHYAEEIAVEGEVARAKKHFWRAHALARKIGYIENSPTNIKAPQAWCFYVTSVC